MRDRASRYIAVILSLLLLAAVPARAGTISFYDVTVSGSFQRGGQDHRLRTVWCTSASSTQTDSSSSVDSTPSSLISTATSPQEGPGAVETIEQGDITGTICDCGEITIRAAEYRGGLSCGDSGSLSDRNMQTGSSRQCIPGEPIAMFRSEPASLLLSRIRARSARSQCAPPFQASGRGEINLQRNGGLNRCERQTLPCAHHLLP